MTAALNLPDRQDWTVDDLADLPKDLRYELVNGRLTLTEFLLREDGDYRASVETDGLVTLDRPWEVTLNLPAWTARRDQVRDSARPKD
jgi:hypothetical protein